MILVAGMHRSGTSCIANVLMELGVPFGDPVGFFGANEWNARGYYEQCDVVDLDNRLITGLPCTDGGWRRLVSNVIYVTHPARSVLRRRFDALRSEMEELDRKYVGVAVKDPRFCLTWPFWEEIRPLEGIVICLRHPLASALSINRRNRVPLSVAFRFWDWHMEGVLAGLSRPGCLWVDYDRLASDAFEPELDAIRRFFELDASPERAREVHAAVFDASLRHFDPPDDGRLPDRTRALWRELLERRDQAASLDARA